MEETMLKRKEIIREYALPFLGMFVVLMICMFLHRSVIPLGAMLGPEEMVGEEMSSPTIGRLVFAGLSFYGFVILTAVSQGIGKQGKIFPSFWCAMFAGTFLWQSIGEDMWHFAVDGVHFVQLESITVLPFVILFGMLLYYVLRHDALGWGVQCTFLSFACNWLGHYILLGVYPLVSSLIDANAWCKLVGIGAGSILTILGVYLGVCKSRNTKERLLSVILTYYGVAVLVFGIMGVS